MDGSSKLFPPPAEHVPAAPLAGLLPAPSFPWRSRPSSPSSQLEEPLIDVISTAEDVPSLGSIPETAQQLPTEHAAVTDPLRVLHNDLRPASPAISPAQPGGYTVEPQSEPQNSRVPKQAPESLQHRLSDEDVNENVVLTGVREYNGQRGGRSTPVLQQLHPALLHLYPIVQEPVQPSQQLQRPSAVQGSNGHNSVPGGNSSTAATPRVALDPPTTALSFPQIHEESSDLRGILSIFGVPMPANSTEGSDHSNGNHQVSSPCGSTEESEAQHGTQHSAQPANLSAKHAQQAQSRSQRRAERLSSGYEVSQQSASDSDAKPEGQMVSPLMKATESQSSISRPAQGRKEVPLDIDRSAHESICKPAATSSVCAPPASMLLEPHNVDSSCDDENVAQTSLSPLTSASQLGAAVNFQHGHSGTLAPQAAISIPQSSENSKPLSTPIEVSLDTAASEPPLSKRKKRIRAKMAAAAAEVVAAGQGEHAAAASRGDPSLSDSEAVASNPPAQIPTVPGSAAAARNGGVQGVTDSEDDYRAIVELDALTHSLSVQMISRGDPCIATVPHSKAESKVVTDPTIHVTTPARQPDPAELEEATSKLKAHPRMQLDKAATQRLLRAHLPSKVAKAGSGKLQGTIAVKQTRALQPEGVMARGAALTAIATAAQSAPQSASQDLVNSQSAGEGMERRGVRAGPTAAPAPVPEWFQDFYPVQEPGAPLHRQSKEEQRAGLIPGSQSKDLQTSGDDSIGGGIRAKTRVNRDTALMPAGEQAPTHAAVDQSLSGRVDFAAIARQFYSSAAAAEFLSDSSPTDGPNAVTVNRLKAKQDLSLTAPVSSPADRQGVSPARILKVPREKPAASHHLKTPPDEHRSTPQPPKSSTTVRAVRFAVTDSGVINMYQRHTPVPPPPFSVPIPKAAVELRDASTMSTSRRVVSCGVDESGDSGSAADDSGRSAPGILARRVWSGTTSTTTGQYGAHSGITSRIPPRASADVVARVPGTNVGIPELAGDISLQEEKLPISNFKRKKKVALGMAMDKASTGNTSSFAPAHGTPPERPHSNVPSFAANLSQMLDNFEARPGGIQTEPYNSLNTSGLQNSYSAASGRLQPLLPLQPPPSYAPISGRNGDGYLSGGGNNGGGSMPLNVAPRFFEQWGAASRSSTSLAASNGVVALATSPQTRDVWTSDQAYPNQEFNAERRALKGTADVQRELAFAHKANRDRALAAEKDALDQDTIMRDGYIASQQLCYPRVEGDLQRAFVARDNAAEEDKLYRSYRQQSNSTAFNSSNVGRRLEHWVDVHGMLIPEALEQLDNDLCCCAGMARDRPEGILMNIIVGKGKHNADGKSRLGPAIYRVLSDAGYRFKPAPGNMGIIVVSIGGLRPNA